MNSLYSSQSTHRNHRRPECTLEVNLLVRVDSLPSRESTPWPWKIPFQAVSHREETGPTGA